MIGIYYIATGQYTMFAEEFVNTVRYFWPEQKKKVVLIGSSDLQKYVKSDEDLTIMYSEINDYPWPIIAMYKFNLLMQNKIDGVDYHFIFNGNTVFCNVKFNWSFFEDNTTIKCTQHAAYESKRTDYIQGGTVCIPDGLFDKFCNEHVRRVNEYMQKKHIVPRWHDETVLNEMLIRDNFLPYKLFPIEQGLRWQWYKHSPHPKCGLCFLRDKPFQQKFKNNYQFISISQKENLRLSLREQHIRRREYEWQPIIDISDEWSAIKVCKCGCTTLSWVCTEYNGAIHTTDPHKDANKYRYFCEKRKKLFMVYRDPIDRLISFYTGNVIKNNEIYYPALREYTEIKTFDDLIDAVEKDFSENNPYYQEHHTRRQVDFYPLDKVDLIVPLWRLDDFLNENGIKVPEHQNVSTIGKLTLTEEQEKRVRNLYAADYELLKSDKFWKS